MKSDFLVILTFILIIIMLLLGIASFIMPYFNNEQIEITIKDKYIKNNKENSKYLVVDENNNTYEITDMLFKGKFNSTDIYNQLEIGKTYKIEISGYRIRFLSIYPNINKILGDDKR